MASSLFIALGKGRARSQTCLGLTPMLTQGTSLRRGEAAEPRPTSAGARHQLSGSEVPFRWDEDQERVMRLEDQGTIACDRDRCYRISLRVVGIRIRLTIRPSWNIGGIYVCRHRAGGVMAKAFERRSLPISLNSSI
jgi:hypothetical protein